MFKNYLLTALRSMRRNIGYNSLNVLGLTLSISSCLFIFLIVRNELSYDSYHKKSSRTYRVTLHGIDYNPAVSMAVVPAMRNDYPELEQVSQIRYRKEGLVKIGTSLYNEKGFAFADDQLPAIFDYQWLAGSPRTALSEPNAAVLTESIARKYFGEKDPMGQVINLDNRFDLKITGLIKDLPGNTHLPLTFLVSFETIKKDMNQAMSNFYAIPDGSFAYIVIPEKYPIARLQNAMPAFISRNWGKDIAKDATLLLQPLKEIHFDQRYLNNTISPTTSRETYWALAAVALFIIITACINFINLATTQSIRRAKEVGVRKVLGAHRYQLVQQFLGETSFLVFLSLILGVTLVIILLPQASDWFYINISLRQLIQPSVIAMLAGITVSVILLAGLYPAFVQSSFRPVESLKSLKGFSFRGLTLRKSLVFIQFVISQVLIVGTLVVASQMDFFQNQDLGFNKDAIITFKVPAKAKLEALRQQLSNNPGVKEMSFSSGAPPYNNNATSFESSELGLTKADVTELKFVDERYIDMFGLKVLAGRNIAKKGEKDTALDVVVNETMIHKLGIQDPDKAIGKHVTLSGDRYSTIIGVVQDFQSESKHKLRRSCVLAYLPDAFFMTSVRIQPMAMRQTISSIDKAWSALFRDNLFDYEFLDDHIASLYKQEEKMYTAFKIFSSLAILIGCMGLYGLIAMAAVQRNREVGIRKVLGASVFSIVSLFAKEFIMLIIVAFLVAAPLAYYVMDGWLHNFAYQVKIGGGIFIISLVISFLIAAITISYHVLKAGTANPVKSLKTE